MRGRSSWRRSTPPGARPGRWSGSGPSISSGSTWKPAASCPPRRASSVLHQGEDLGRWVRTVRLGWDKLTTVQQWMCEHVLGIEPAAEGEKPQPRRTRAGKWAVNYEAARQFFEREGHLRVPRKHIEKIVGEDQEERELRLGAWIGNQRSRAATLTPERMEQLSAIGTRWS